MLEWGVVRAREVFVREVRETKVRQRTQPNAEDLDVGQLRCLGLLARQKVSEAPAYAIGTRILRAARDAAYLHCRHVQPLGAWRGLKDVVRGEGLFRLVFAIHGPHHIGLRRADERL